MKIEYLREYLKLAGKLNISTVSKELYISQSTLSRHMQALEKSLGFALLTTSSHEISLTDAGRNAIPAFQRMLDEYDSFIAKNRPDEQSYTGTLRIGLMYYLVEGPYMEFLDHFREKYPNVDLICMSSYQPQTLMDDLLQQKVEIGILPSYLNNLSKIFRYQKIENLGTIAMMRDDNPLARKESVTLNELSSMPLVKLSIDALSQKQIDYLLDTYNFVPASIVYTEDIETVPFKIKRTNGFHITGTPCLKQNASGIAYVRVSETRGFENGLVSCVRKGKLVDLFFKEAKECFRGHKG